MDQALRGGGICSTECPSSLYGQTQVGHLTKMTSQISLSFLKYAMTYLMYPPTFDDIASCALLSKGWRTPRCSATCSEHLHSISVEQFPPSQSNTGLEKPLEGMLTPELSCSQHTTGFRSLHHCAAGLQMVPTKLAINEVTLLFASLTDSRAAWAEC